MCVLNLSNPNNEAIVNEAIRKAKIKQMRKLLKKIEKTENEIRKRKRQAGFDKRYSKQGQLSDSCCKVDDLKIQLIELNEQKRLLEK